MRGGRKWDSLRSTVVRIGWHFSFMSKQKKNLRVGGSIRRTNSWEDEHDHRGGSGFLLPNMSIDRILGSG